MNYTEHKITLDVNKPASQATISVKKGDTARRLLVNLSESGRPYYISQDCYAVIAATKPDGYVIFNNCTIQDSVIGYDFTAQTVAAVGLMNCEIIVYGKRGLQLTSASFDIIIEDSNFTSVESSSEANAFATLIMEIKALNALGLRAPAIICEAKGENISITDASNEALQGLRIFGKSTQETEPTMDSPVEIVSVGAGGSIKAKVMGKNIASDMVYASFSTDYASLVMCNDTGAVEKGKTYTISVTLTASKETKAYWNSLSKIFANETITVLAGTNRYSKTFTALEDGISGKERILLSKSATGDGVAIKSSECQIELGSVATDFEITDQSVVLDTPGGLLSVPISRMGVHPHSYTDGDGKCWVGDEVDLKRGVYVQRIGTITSADMRQGFVALNQESDNYNQYTVNSVLGPVVPGVSDSASTSSPYKAVCNCLPLGGQVSAGTKKDAFWIYSLNVIVLVLNKTDFPNVQSVENWLANNDVEIQYIMKEPIEMALSGEEITAFAQLQTYKPNTSIYNDAGAYMAAEYVADTKTYVDRNGGSGGSGGSSVTLGTVTLLASRWQGTTDPYYQVVSIAGVTANSQVDLKPSVAQLAIFHDKDLAFVTENDGGIVTVYAIGDKPENDYTIQVSITEVNV